MLLKKSSKIILTVSTIIYLLIFLLYFLLPAAPIIGYTIIYIAASIFFLILCRQIFLINIHQNFILYFTAAIIILKIVFIQVHPIGSDDFYRYLWDGKVQANGINPYAYSPNDEELAYLHSQILPKYVNHADMKTLYPPLTEIFFYFSYLISGESYTGLKVLLLLLDLITIYGIFLILKKLNIDKKNILIYVLSPLPIFQFFIDAHADGYGLAFIIFAIFFYLDNKKILSYVLIGLSICIKPIGLLFIPLLFFNEKSLQERIKVVLIPAFICAAMYIPYVFTGSPFQALIKFTENWTFNGIVFDVLNSFMHNNQEVRLVCGILYFLIYILIVLSKKDLFNKIYLSVFLLLIFSPVVHPWYAGWLLVLLPFVPRWSGIFYVSLISLTAITDLNYQLSGVWKEYTLVLILEYVPILSIFLYEIFKSRKFSRLNLK
jgi:alpha-1,6-mannosyltransferase